MVEPRSRLDPFRSTINQPFFNNVGMGALWGFAVQERPCSTILCVCLKLMIQSKFFGVNTGIYKDLLCMAQAHWLPREPQCANRTIGDTGASDSWHQTECSTMCLKAGEHQPLDFGAYMTNSWRYPRSSEHLSASYNPLIRYRLVESVSSIITWLYMNYSGSHPLERFHPWCRWLWHLKINVQRSDQSDQIWGSQQNHKKSTNIIRNHRV